MMSTEGIRFISIFHKTQRTLFCQTLCSLSFLLSWKDAAVQFSFSGTILITLMKTYGDQIYNAKKASQRGFFHGLNFKIGLSLQNYIPKR